MCFVQGKASLNVHMVVLFGVYIVLRLWIYLPVQLDAAVLPLSHSVHTSSAVHLTQFDIRLVQANVSNRHKKQFTWKVSQR